MLRVRQRRRAGRMFGEIVQCSLFNVQLSFAVSTFDDN